MKHSLHNIAFSLEHIAQNHPNQTAIIESHTGTSISFRELSDESSRIASGLNQYGLKKGDHVLFTSYAGTEIKIDNVDYLIMTEDDILGIIE